jgi:hypothetical protein
MLTIRFFFRGLKLGILETSWKTFLKILGKIFISLRVFILPDIFRADYIG